MISDYDRSVVAKDGQVELSVSHRILAKFPTHSTASVCKSLMSGRNRNSYHIESAYLLRLR